MQRMIEKALANPWAVLEYVLDGPLHPGGKEGSEALMDRADVGEGTRVLDVGCGLGHSIALARERGAEVIGLDLDPPRAGVRGDLSVLPIHDESVDVVLAECVLCLVPERSLAFDELRRVVRSNGRLGLSDIVLEGEVPALPEPIAEALCLSNASSRDQLIERIERAGFIVEEVQDHHGDLLTMRDRIEACIDYEAFLGTVGERGDELSAAIEDIETAVKTGRIGYVSLVAERDP